MGNPLPYINSYVYRVGEIKVLYLNITVNNMSYDTSYDCGIINSEFSNKYNYTDIELHGNSRLYKYYFSGGNLKLTCKTNTLPPDGRPSVGASIVYI